jgi:hypothetical protein
MKTYRLRSRKPILTAVGTRCVDTFYQQMLTLTSPKNGGRSVGIVRLRTKAAELFFYKQSHFGT